MESLRGEQLAFRKDFDLEADQPLWLGDWPATAGTQAEVVIVFEVPSTSGTFGVDVVTGSSLSDPGTRIYFDFVRDAANITVGISDRSGGSNKTTSQFMPGICLIRLEYSLTFCKELICPAPTSM